MLNMIYRLIPISISIDPTRKETAMSKTGYTLYDARFDKVPFGWKHALDIAKETGEKEEDIIKWVQAHGEGIPGFPEDASWKEGENQGNYLYLRTPVADKIIIAINNFVTNQRKYAIQSKRNFVITNFPKREQLISDIGYEKFKAQRDSEPENGDTLNYKGFYYIDNIILASYDIEKRQVRPMSFLFEDNSLCYVLLIFKPGHAPGWSKVDEAGEYISLLERRGRPVIVITPGGIVRAWTVKKTLARWRWCLNGVHIELHNRGSRYESEKPLTEAERNKIEGWHKQYA